MRSLLLLLLLLTQDPAPEVPVPAPQTIYVSSSAGDDTSAVPDDPDRPWKTLGAAIKALRTTKLPDGVACEDSLLLARGDVFDEPPVNIPFHSGSSSEQPFRVGAYGEGPRPIVVTAKASTGRRSWRHVRVCGIDFWGKADDPLANEPGFTPLGCKWGGTWGQSDVIEDIELVNCRWRFCAVVLQRPVGSQARNEDRVTFRRCLLLDAYGTSGALTSNLFVHLLPVTLEGCILDRGGWNPDVPSAAANVFKHNAYISHCPDVRVVGCMFLRASSIGLKLRSDVAGGMRAARIRDNLFIEGDIAVSAGGNTNDLGRFTDCEISSNVLLHIGRAAPMARGVAWGVELRDWSGGFVANNVMLGEPGLPNTFFLAFRGGFTGTRVEGNYCSGVIASTGTIALDGGPGQAITFRDNLFDVSDGIALSSQAPPVAIVWERNDFEPVPLPSRATRIKLRAGTKPTPVGALQTLVGEPLPVLPDPTVDLPLAWDEFLARVREQGQADAWDEALTASAINARVRAAVGIGPSL